MESSSDMCHIKLCEGADPQSAFGDFVIWALLHCLFVPTRLSARPVFLLSSRSPKISLSFLASQHLDTGGLGLS